MNLCGLVWFYGVVYGVGIKFIVGVDFWLRSFEFLDELSCIIILVKDNEGYKNFILLIFKVY